MYPAGNKRSRREGNLRVGPAPFANSNNTRRGTQGNNQRPEVPRPRRENYPIFLALKNFLYQSKILKRVV